jgi:hypothetical protein
MVAVLHLLGNDIDANLIVVERFPCPYRVSQGPFRNDAVRRAGELP